MMTWLLGVFVTNVTVVRVSLFNKNMVAMGILNDASWGDSIVMVARYIVQCYYFL